MLVEARSSECKGWAYWIEVEVILTDRMEAVRVERIRNLACPIWQPNRHNRRLHALGKGSVAVWRCRRPVPVRKAPRQRGLRISLSLCAGRKVVDSVDDVLIERLLEECQICAMPCQKEIEHVHAVARTVQTRLGRRVVPWDVWSAVNAGDLVVGGHVVLISFLEALHAEKEDVPLVGIPLKLADLESRLDAECGDAGGDDRLALPPLETSFWICGIVDFVLAQWRSEYERDALREKDDEQDATDAPREGHVGCWIRENGFMRMRDLDECIRYVGVLDEQRRIPMARRRMQILLEDAK